MWPGRRRFPAPRWPWARLRNETPCTTPQLAARRELPLTPPRGIKPRHAAARADPGEPVEQLLKTPSSRTVPPLLPPRTYRPHEEQHGPVQLPQEAQGLPGAH